jgi:hypothetical protein
MCYVQWLDPSLYGEFGMELEVSRLTHSTHVISKSQAVYLLTPLFVAKYLCHES